MWVALALRGSLETEPEVLLEHERSQLGPSTPLHTSPLQGKGPHVLRLPSEWGWGEQREAGLAQGQIKGTSPGSDCLAMTSDVLLNTPPTPTPPLSVKLTLKSGSCLVGCSEELIGQSTGPGWGLLETKPSAPQMLLRHLL